MSLAKNFNEALHNELTIYAAWYPVANTLKLGDFGLIEGGVFRALGNITQFGITFVQQSAPPASIDFMSHGATVVRMVGGMQVASLPQLPEVGNLEARLTFNFQRENSCLIKAALTVVEMQDIHGVTNKLGKLDEWENRFRVVSATYTGEQCMILTAREANTIVEVSGTVDVLKQVELGKVEVKPSISSSNERIFKSVGDTGVVGLRLFKLRWLFGGPKLLGPRGEVPIDDTWGADLEDDL